MNCGTEKGLLQHKARNEPPCRWCVKFRDDLAQPPKPEPKPVQHGTDAGYWREKRSGKEACEECKTAHSAYNADRKRKTRAASKPVKPPAEPAPCGTYAAAGRHKRRGEPLDDACRQARRDYQNDQKKRLRGPAKPHDPKPITHGTLAGRSAHYYRGEAPCDDCKNAYNKAARDNRAERKEAA